MMLANLGGLYSAGKSELQALIDSLFGAGEQGLLFVPEPGFRGEDVLYQDAAGTTLADANGDPVGRGDEFSGNDNSLTQSTSADRPLYQTDGTLHWLGFDGAGDFLRTVFPDPISQPVTHIIAFRLRETGTTQNIFNNVLNKRFYLAEVDGNFQVSAGSEIDVQPVDTDIHVFTVVFAGSSSYVRADGVQAASGAIGNNQLRGVTIAANENDGFPGKVDIFAHAIVAGIPPVETIEQAERLFASRAGKTL